MAKEQSIKHVVAPESSRVVVHITRVPICKLQYRKTISRWRLMSRADHLTDGAQLHISYYTCALSFPGMRLRFTVQEATRCPDTPH